MELPATTLAVITAAVTDAVTANGLIIVGVLGLAVGVTFVMRWFNKSTRRIKA